MTGADNGLEEERRELRLRVIDALEGTGWGIQLSGEDLILGDGMVSVQVLPRRVLLLYAYLPSPNINDSDDINEVNAEFPLGGFLMHYAGQNGRALGAFQRFIIPEATPSRDELGRWIETQVIHVRAMAKTFDDSFGED